VNISPENNVVTLPYNIGVYASSFGNAKVMLTPHATTSVVSAIPTGSFKIAVFDPFSPNELGKTGDFTAVQIVGEYGLKHREEPFAGKLTTLATS
jgi:hypothetical protein